MMTSAQKANLSGIKALVFDVFGTVVDWRGSVAPQVAEVAERHGVAEGDWLSFADRWRQWYGQSCSALSRGEGHWRLVDQIHRERLDELLQEFGLANKMPETEKQNLNRAWHRLNGWPDSVAGLHRLKSKYIISTLSNGNVSLLVNMAKRAELPWDVILGADVVGAYKPNPRVYRKAAELLGLNPDEVMMVAAHHGDLHAAKTEGMTTAFVHRPLEHGKDRIAELPSDTHSFDIVATDFLDLADQLGCD